VAVDDGVKPERESLGVADRSKAVRGRGEVWRAKPTQDVGEGQRARNSARRRSRAHRDRRRPTASPKRPGFLKLRARGNAAA
jgi:hypothetical protein